MDNDPETAAGNDNRGAAQNPMYTYDTTETAVGDDRGVVQNPVYDGTEMAVENDHGAVQNPTYGDINPLPTNEGVQYGATQGFSGDRKVPRRGSTHVVEVDAYGEYLEVAEDGDEAMKCELSKVHGKDCAGQKMKQSEFCKKHTCSRNGCYKLKSSTADFCKVHKAGVAPSKLQAKQNDRM
jgi:hypothetical protein